MYSEETLKLNKALTYCLQLKSELNDTIGHIRKLSKKYDQIDYMEGFREWEKSYMQLTPTRKPTTPIRCNIRKKLIATSTPKTSTPILSGKTRIAIDFPNIKRKRAPREIKHNNNKIIVHMLKVQRNIESIINKMKVLQRTQQKNQAIALEQSLYQSCDNSSCYSPGKLGHSQCSLDHLTFNDSFGGQHHNRSSNFSPKHKQHLHRTPVKEAVYLTPLRQIQKRAVKIHLRLSKIKSC